jgi:hypothetical protein
VIFSTKGCRAEGSTSLIRRWGGLGASLAHLFGTALGGHYAQLLTAPGLVGAYLYAVPVSVTIGDDHTVTVEAGLNDVCTSHDMAYGPGVTSRQERGDPSVSGELSRAHWIVPVHGLSAGSANAA